MAKGTWKEPVGAELVAPFLNKNGSFKPPKRQAFESYWAFNERYKRARKLYDQYKGLSHGSEVGNRQAIRQHKLKIKEIAQLRNKINKLALADESNMYAASLSIKTLGERLNKLEKSLKIKPSKIPTTQKGFLQLREKPLTGSSLEETSEVDNSRSGLQPSVIIQKPEEKEKDEDDNTVSTVKPNLVPAVVSLYQNKGNKNGIVNTSDKDKLPVETNEEATLVSELRALNKINSGNVRGLEGNRVTLRIMRKEQQLWKLRNPDVPFPRFTGRDTMRVGYGSNQEVRDYTKKSPLHIRERY